MICELDPVRAAERDAPHAGRAAATPRRSPSSRPSRGSARRRSPRPAMTRAGHPVDPGPGRGRRRRRPLRRRRRWRLAAHRARRRPVGRRLGGAADVVRRHRRHREPGLPTTARSATSTAPTARGSTAHGCRVVLVPTRLLPLRHRHDRRMRPRLLQVLAHRPARRRPSTTMNSIRKVHRHDHASHEDRRRRAVPARSATTASARFACRGARPPRPPSSPSRCRTTCPAGPPKLAPQDAETVYVIVSGELVMASRG